MISKTLRKIDKAISSKANSPFKKSQRTVRRKNKPDELLHEDLRRDMLRFAALQLRDTAAAEDAVQEAMAAAYTSHLRYRESAQYKTWVFAILRNKVIDILRERIRHPTHSYQEYPGTENELDNVFDVEGFWYQDTSPTDWSDPETALINEYFWRVLEICLTELPDNTARVFMMRELLGFKTSEIAVELSITESNIWVILHRARIRLRSCLENNWFGEA